jgi:hypothetical protein
MNRAKIQEQKMEEILGSATAESPLAILRKMRDLDIED